MSICRHRAGTWHAKEVFRNLETEMRPLCTAQDSRFCVCVCVCVYIYIYIHSNIKTVYTYMLYVMYTVLLTDNLASHLSETQ